MTYDPTIHHRRSIRLKGFDYSQPGAYFLTICTNRHACLFGEVVDAEMVPNEVGQCICTWWAKLAEKFPSVVLDTFVVMPNHVHGVLIIPASAEERSAGDVTPNDGQQNAPALMDEEVSLPRMVQWFKIMTTNAYIQAVKTKGWTPFDGRLWQRNYWERVIRSQRELDNVRRYIHENPSRWQSDAFRSPLP